VDSHGSGYGSLAGSCECRDDSSGSGARELVMCLYLTHVLHAVTSLYSK
jgi:hypothetical protein